MGQSILEPQLMQNVADWTDKKEGETVKRKSEGFIDKLKEGTPGLRKNLKEEDNLKLSKKDQEEYSNIIDKGINIPELNRRTSYRVKNNEKHPGIINITIFVTCSSKMSYYDIFLLKIFKYFFFIIFLMKLYPLN
jgi:hypothetical protein